MITEFDVFEGFTAKFVEENPGYITGIRTHAFPASLGWKRDDPAAVHLVMPYRVIPGGGVIGEGENRWVFARKLIIDSALGLKDTGEGQVRIEPAMDGLRKVLLLHLTSRDWHGHILIPRGKARLFAYETLLKIPQEDEDYAGQVDNALGKILA